MLRQPIIRRKRNPRTPPPVKNIFIITLILFVFMTSISIWVIDKGIKPTLMRIAEVKTTEFATRAINTAVRFAENYNFEDLISMTEDNEGNITTYGWNSAVVSEINRVSTDRVEEFFISMNEGRQPRYEESLNDPIEYDGGAENLPKKDPTVVEIPLGQATGNSVLANLGPKIPVNLELVGNVQTDVVRDIKDLGINGALVTIYIIVEADVQIVIPFTTDLTRVSTKIYIDSRVVMGDVPEFFSGSGDGDPSISIDKDSLLEDE
ncbi:sporulation protein YunB [Virgibacillus salinus]|uniref:Sporulation protein YunB n=1 Tax=Virgibacillus salinus TaxID=553311 RepID=A0A1H0ZLE8_9BACI|nr:sporulation protein YunB [Virgibacillus salinus]SDQ28177.1 sporulation protein YunB [Virgibacillus salinus]